MTPSVTDSSNMLHSRECILDPAFNNGSLITLKYSNINYFRNLGREFCILDLYLQGMNLPPLHSCKTYTNSVSLYLFLCLSILLLHHCFQNSPQHFIHRRNQVNNLPYSNWSLCVFLLNIIHSLVLKFWHAWGYS